MQKTQFCKNHSSFSILGGLFLVQHKPTHTSVPFQRAWRFSIVLRCSLGLCCSAIKGPLRSSQVLLNKTFSSWSSANTKAKGKERRTFLLYFFFLNIYLLFSFVCVCGAKFEVPFRSLSVSLLSSCSPAAPQNGLAFWLFFTCSISAVGAVRRPYLRQIRLCIWTRPGAGYKWISLQILAVLRREEGWREEKGRRREEGGERREEGGGRKEERGGRREERGKD